MPKAKLTTKTAVDQIPLLERGQTIYWDTDLTGFGVRVGAREKTFIVERRIKGKPQPVRVTLGRVGQMTLQKARQDAEAMIGEIAVGTNPVKRNKDETAGGLTLRQAWEDIYKPNMLKKLRSTATLDDYQSKIDCYLTDWLDRPLVNIDREMVDDLHAKIGRNYPTMANGTMRVLRAIWRRARKKYPYLPETPTNAIDFYPETGRTNVIKNWPAWWAGIHQIENPVRRDLYIWLAFSGCRSGESMRIAVKNIDLKNGVIHFPITKTLSLDLPLSGFMLDLVRDRIADNAETYGANCPWLFPSLTSVSGHLEEEKLTPAEKKFFSQHWSPHVLRHSWITIADQKIKISDAHQRALTNHKPKRSKHNDAHAGYIHPDLDDLLQSQNAMTKYLLAQIKPKPVKGKKQGDNVVPFKAGKVA